MERASEYDSRELARVTASWPAADFCIRGPADHGGCPYVALYGIESPILTTSLAIVQYVLQFAAVVRIADDGRYRAVAFPFQRFPYERCHGRPTNCSGQTRNRAKQR